MMRGLQFWRSRCGASAVEFALVLPPFLLLLFGTIEFGRLFWTSHALEGTAIATARCMGVPQLECTKDGVYSEDDAVVFANSMSRSWYVRLETGSIQIVRDATCHDLDDFSTVTITHRFRTVMPDFLMALMGGVELRASACYPNHSH